MALRTLFFPKFSRDSWTLALKCAFWGCLVFGSYGAAFDQLTYSISPEYFTLLKFDQFAWANPGLENPRWFVSLIGFIAAGGGGFISGWILARIALAGSENPTTMTALNYFWLCPVLAMLFAPVGYLISRLHTPESWTSWMTEVGVNDQEAFAGVGMIHNFSYLGAISGLVIAAIRLKRRRVRAD